MKLFRSKPFNISRELYMSAPPETTFPHINNSRLAHAWMPWSDSDPGVQIRWSGPEEGVGAGSNWDSKGKMGTGQALVIESIFNQRVRTQLTYTRPMTMQQLATVSLIPRDGGTIVRWEVEGENNLLGRFFCLFMNMDKMVGKEFEKGLNNLKSKVEV